MPKAHSPVRLEASLMESAALAGEAFKRSAAEQVEFWAAIGRLVAPRMTPNEILELQAGLVQLELVKAKPIIIDSDGLLAEIEQRQRSGSIQKAIANRQIRYQASISHPGYLEQVTPAGEVITGQFIHGQFEPKA